MTLFLRFTSHTLSGLIKPEIFQKLQRKSKTRNFTIIRLVGVALFYANGRIERHDETNSRYSIKNMPKVGTSTPRTSLHISSPMLTTSQHITFDRTVTVNSIKILVFTIRTGCVLCEVWTEFYSLHNLYESQQAIAAWDLCILSC